MKIHYNRDVHIAGIGVAPWPRLGPELWFDDYKIITANSFGFGEDFVIDLRLAASASGKMTTREIISSTGFRDSVATKLPSYRFLLYKPIKPEDAPEGLTFLANDSQFSRYEDKEYFRTTFENTLPIPKFKKLPMDDVLMSDTAKLHEELSGSLGGAYVVQDAKNSGGRGTFMIDTARDLARCQRVLSSERLADTVIVSEFVKGRELSVQACVTSQGIFSGPAQQQLVRCEELQNVYGRGGIFFCGGRLLRRIDEQLRQQVDQVIQQIGNRLQGEGYKGMFGVDFIVAKDSTLKVIEINARITGMLPLLNEQTSDVPLYLLHILELASEKYEITSLAAASQPVVSNKAPESFVILYNQNRKKSHFDVGITTGNYSYYDGHLVKLDDSPRWDKRAECMIQLLATVVTPAKPNAELANVFLSQEGFDESGRLSSHAVELIEKLKQHVVEVD